jgi:hypothetical protein
MKIVIDGVEKADIPTDNTKHSKFLSVLEMFIHQDWKEFKLERGGVE